MIVYFPYKDFDVSTVLYVKYWVITLHCILIIILPLKATCVAKFTTGALNRRNVLRLREPFSSFCTCTWFV